ncbi:MAG: discoidin domain-containing protein [Oscillospiraceae bacterium]
MPSAVTDGNYTAFWDGAAAPAEFEIDLQKWYELDKIVAFPYYLANRYYHYEVYTSCNGLDYQLVGKKDNNDRSTASGEAYVFEEPVLARFIKVRMTYNSPTLRFICTKWKPMALRPAMRSRSLNCPTPIQTTRTTSPMANLCACR